MRPAEICTDTEGMTNDSTLLLAAIVFGPGEVEFLAPDGTALPAPRDAVAVALAALWERPSAN